MQKQSDELQNFIADKTISGYVVHAYEASSKQVQDQQPKKHEGPVHLTFSSNGSTTQIRSAQGLADIAEGRMMTDDTIFAIASLTKPFTATTVLILQDEGKLFVDDPVEKYLPKFKNLKLKDGTVVRPLTIRDLLTHTSGIANPAKPDPTMTLAEAVDALAEQPLMFEPGSKWQYGQGLTVCGRIIEVVAGKPFETVLEEKLCKPLGLTDTTFYPTPAQRKRLATIYKQNAEKTVLEPVASRATFLGDVAGEKKRYPNPSGGLFSTASDLQTFYEMILNSGLHGGKQVVSAPAVKQMTTVQTGDLETGFTPGNGWGLGWCVVREPQGVTAMLSPGSFGHGGAFGTQGWIDPKKQRIFVLLFQRQGLPNSDASDVRRSVSTNHR
ncbi:MAG: serine hydrolase domain-containing protein [Pirellulales bacterium]